ncbi:hypothetical protein [Chitinophaga tropicalis]|uniref:Uncharacterized protein n=1 Tax=Chitinophaga tropicalis TaxID=2683588 RepID=A0A7K1UD28_9BACT|nr:hypothetical protein [Chitinophaga tropicalis]MVT12226.1 hypothetical protein [Chitinophaga tropicalis]
MKHQVLFGIKCDFKDEKALLKAIKDYLAKFNRTPSTVQKGSMLEARLPHRIRQFHWNLNKETGTWFELFPNQDLDNKYFSENHKDCTWLALILFHLDFPGYEKNKSEKFIIDMLDSIGFNYEILLETDNKERIKGDAVS